MACLPLVEIGATTSEKSKALSVIGVDNTVIFGLLKQHDLSLLNAFRVVLFAMNLKHYPLELRAFIRRIEFKNKGFENRFLKYFKQDSSDKNVLSIDELNDMWKLESKYDDFGKPISD
tara:strand:- start:438 stop:791 length:354 start_codon:yes stop_codon:yes gene_type:complete